MAKKLSTGAKVGIGIGVLGAVALGVYYTTKPAVAGTATSGPALNPSVPSSTIPAPPRGVFDPNMVNPNALTPSVPAVLSTLSNGQTYKFVITLDPSIDSSTLANLFGANGLTNVLVTPILPTVFGTFDSGLFGNAAPLPQIPGVTWLVVAQA